MLHLDKTSPLHRDRLKGHLGQYTHSLLPYIYLHACTHTTTPHPVLHTSPWHPNFSTFPPFTRRQLAQCQRLSPRLPACPGHQTHKG